MRHDGTRQRARVAVVLSAIIGVFGCTARVVPHVTPLAAPVFSGAEMIGELKAFEEALGSTPTENFLAYSARIVSDNRCYFTGKLQLPEFYSALRLAREDEAHCQSRANEFDVFFYPVQAVASGEETITVALAEAPVERQLVVVPHEDFHNQPEARKAPTEVAEAAATLVGFLTARGFAQQKFGDGSATFQAVARDVDLFLLKSWIVNTYYDNVREVYKALDAGALTREQALARKSELFAGLEQSCSAITPDPVSFNKCPAAMNNAGLAFDRTYTHYYPLMHELYVSLGREAPVVVQELKRLMAQWPASVTSVADLMKAAR
jgi:hypothetical protein